MFVPTIYIWRTGARQRMFFSGIWVGIPRYAIYVLHNDVRDNVTRSISKSNLKIAITWSFLIIQHETNIAIRCSSQDIFLKEPSFGFSGICFQEFIKQTCLAPDSFNFTSDITNQITNSVKKNHLDHDDKISDVTAWLWILPSIFMFMSWRLCGKQCKNHNHTSRLHIAKVYLTKQDFLRIAGQRSKSQGPQVTLTLYRT